MWTVKALSLLYNTNAFGFFFYDTTRKGSQTKICLVGRFEVFQGLLGVRLNGGTALLPVGRANFTVDISELEGFNETKDFINVAADRKVVDSDLANSTVGVNDEKTYTLEFRGRDLKKEAKKRLQIRTTKSDTGFFNKDTVFTSDVLGLVSKDRDLHFTKTTLLARSVDPSQVREFCQQRTQVSNQELADASNLSDKQNIPESVEAARTTVSKASNSLTRSEKARISVGQTNVKSMGYQKRTTYLPR